MKFARDVPQRERTMDWFEEVEGIVERTTPVPVAAAVESEEAA